MKTITIPPAIQLPAVSTEIGPISYSFVSFLREWVLGAKGLREDENLPHLFSMEDTINQLQTALEEKVGRKEPELPKMPPPPQAENMRSAYMEEVQAIVTNYRTETEAYRTALDEASVGMVLEIPDATYFAAKAATKAALDAACERDPSGRVGLHPAYVNKILRLYHTFASAK